MENLFSRGQSLAPNGIREASVRERDGSVFERTKTGRGGRTRGGFVQVCARARTNLSLSQPCP